MPTPLAEMGKYKVVVVDPPWDIPRINFSHHDYAPRLQYSTMSLDGIAALPVQDVLADESWVFCWTTNAFLRHTPEILEAWGLTVTFTMTWDKGAGPQAPNTPCFNSEFIVVGRKGRPQFRDTKAFRTANYWPRGHHSEKPEEFYDLLRRVTEGPRLDVFGRRRIAGFESWGDEAPEGPASPDHFQNVLDLEAVT